MAELAGCLATPPPQGGRSRLPQEPAPGWLPPQLVPVKLPQELVPGERPRELVPKRPPQAYPAGPGRRRASPVLLQAGPGEFWAGVDEVGRGPLAGPLVVCALVAGPELPEGLADSKGLSPAQRERLWWPILQACRDVRVVVAPPALIDRENIHRATLQAMAAAVEALTVPFQRLWVDGRFTLKLTRPVHQQALVEADARIACVAAASVIAKVVRDAIMVALDRHFPGYQLARHKGYPTAEHRRALQQLGPCAVHRRSFRLVSGQVAGL